MDTFRPDFPEFELPSYRGERYEAVVPDTLDLQDRARLVLHCMTEATNPSADYEIYGIVQFLCRPPQMQMDWGGPTVQVKFQEGVPLVRMICGSDQNLHVERRWMETTLQSIGDDGLIYTPIGGRPWTYRRGPRAEGPNAGQLLVPFTCGRMLSTMSVYAYRDGGNLWRDAVRRLVDALLDLAVYQDDIAYFLALDYGRDQGEAVEQQPVDQRMGRRRELTGAPRVGERIPSAGVRAGLAAGPQDHQLPAHLLLRRRRHVLVRAE